MIPPTIKKLLEFCNLQHQNCKSAQDVYNILPFPPAMKERQLAKTPGRPFAFQKRILKYAQTFGLPFNSLHEELQQLLEECRSTAPDVTYEHHHPHHNRHSEFSESTGDESSLACTECTLPITGARYKCMLCVNYDLCDTCESRNATDFFHYNGDHFFIKIYKPNSFSWKKVWQARTQHLPPTVLSKYCHRKKHLSRKK